MTSPVRLQLSRRKGFDLQAWSREVNGLPAVNVARPGRFGNPFNFRASDCCWAALSVGCRGDARGRQEASVRFFRMWISPPYGRRHLAFEEQVKFGRGDDFIAVGPKIAAGEAPSLDEIRTALAGKNLTCWCALCDEHGRGKPLGSSCAACAPCHADVLGELANG